MKSTRSYTMGARAGAVAETRQRIIDTLFDLGRERMFPDISLDDVAAAADRSDHEPRDRHRDRGAPRPHR